MKLWNVPKEGNKLFLIKTEIHHNPQNEWIFLRVKSWVTEIFLYEQSSDVEETDGGFRGVELRGEGLCGHVQNGEKWDLQYCCCIPVKKTCRVTIQMFLKQLLCLNRNWPKTAVLKDSEWVTDVFMSPHSPNSPAVEETKRSEPSDESLGPPDAANTLGWGGGAVCSPEVRFFSRKLTSAHVLLYQPEKLSLWKPGALSS